MNHKRHILFAFVLVLFAAGPLFSYRTYDADSPEVWELRRLYTLAGRAFPAAAFPLSGERLAALAEALIKEASSSGLRLQAAELIESLALPEKGAALIGTDLDIALEGNYHGGYQRESRPDPSRTFYDRFVLFPDMFKVKAYAERAKFPGLQLSFAIKSEYHRDEIPWSNLFFASPDDPFQIENYFVRTGFFAWQNDVFEIRLGRSPVHYGDSRFSTFLPGKRLPYLDSLEYRYRIGPLELVSYFGMLDNRLTGEEKTFLRNEGLSIFEADNHPAGHGKIYLGSDNWFYSSGTPLGTDPTAEKLSLGSGQTIVLNSLHRFVWRTKKLSIGMSALMLVARENNALTLADIFPVFSWHNGEVGNNNMSLLFDALWNFYPGFSLYAQAGWDDINAADLFGIPDGDIPTIGAYLLGFAYEGSFFSKPMSLTFEGGSTHYLWGNYYAYSTDIKQGNYFARAIYRYKAQKASHIMPLTSPYGPGAFWTDLRLALGRGKGFSGEVFLSYLSRLEGASLVTTEYQRQDSLKDGPRDQSWALDFKLIYTFPQGKRWTASLYGAAGFYVYNGRFWPEFRLGGKLSGQFLFPVSFLD